MHAPDLAAQTHRDDEYVWAGVEDPKVVVTTSHDPSSRLKQFAKVKKKIILCVEKFYFRGSTVHVQLKSIRVHLVLRFALYLCHTLMISSINLFLMKPRV